MTTGLFRRDRTPRMRPLAVALTALCTAASAWADATPRLTDDASVRELARRSGVTLLAPPPPHATALVTNCDDSGPGSLRDALEAAVTNDAVDLTQLTCSRISLTTGAIVFGANNVAIQGPGRNELLIDGGLGGGVLYHLGFGTLIVEDVSIGYGFKYDPDNQIGGSCVHSGGNVALANVDISVCNTVSGGSYSALGGAVYAANQIQIVTSSITTSEAKANGTGYASGGGLYAVNGITSIYSTVANNVALGEGGTPSYGGGIFSRGSALILGSEISGNQALRMGGIAFVDYHDSPVTVANSTISGNRATRFGGMFALTSLSLYNDTIAFNTSHEWTDGTHYFAAGVHIMVPGEMDSTIIANNVNDGAPAQYPTVDLTGEPGSGFNGGHNNVMLCGAPCPNDTSHEDPGLHPLSDNGGLTRTHVPTPGVWDTFGGTNLLGLPFDQRGPGFPRQSAGDFPEIGALQINSDIIFANGFN